MPCRRRQREGQRIAAISEDGLSGGALLAFHPRQSQFREVARANKERGDHRRRSERAADDEKDEDCAVRHDISHSIRRLRVFSATYAISGRSETRRGPQKLRNRETARGRETIPAQ